MGSSASVQVVSGTMIGPYVVERKLAQGGMSVLFLAHDTQLDRPVALKMLAEEIATHATRARMLREARTLAAVDHPGIVRIYGAGELEGKPWIAMELVRGTDLKRLLAERGPVPPSRALRWMLQATEALAAAHDVGVVHRDLKPSNLLLTHDDRIKVVDFGVAKRRLDASSGSGDVLTSQGEVLGTPAYLSPEQLEHGLADERSDVWGLGCVLYELCTGSPPFGRSSSAATTAAILRDEPVFPHTMVGAVVDVITACLRKSSFARVASMRELGAFMKDSLEQAYAPQTASTRPSDKQSVHERTSVPDRPSAHERLSAVDRTVRELPSFHDTTARGSSTRQSVPPLPPLAPSARIPSSPPARPSDAPPPLSARPPLRTSIAARPLRTSAPPPAQSSGPVRVVRGRMKGTAVRSGMIWFEKQYGHEALVRTWEEGSPELRAVVRLEDPSFGIVASAWYDTRVVGELLGALERTAGSDDPDTWANAVGEAIAKDNVAGVYRSLFRLVTTPAMLEANAQRVWRTYCDEGVLLAHAPRAGELQLEIRHWTHHHEMACRVVGFTTQHVLRSLGYEGLVIERTWCVSSGDPMCAFEGMYLPK